MRFERRSCELGIDVARSSFDVFHNGEQGFSSLHRRLLLIRCIFASLDVLLKVDHLQFIFLNFVL